MNDVRIEGGKLQEFTTRIFSSLGMTEKDAALERRFQPVYVGEPSVADAIAICRGLKERYEAHHGVRIRDAALVAASEYMKSVNMDSSTFLIISITLSVLVGTLTFTGSFIAFGKLQGLVTTKPVTFPGQQALNALLAIVMFAAAYMIPTYGINSFYKEFRERRSKLEENPNAIKEILEAVLNLPGCGDGYGGPEPVLPPGSEIPDDTSLNPEEMVGDGIKLAPFDPLVPALSPGDFANDSFGQCQAGLLPSDYGPGRSGLTYLKDVSKILTAMEMSYLVKSI